ncbi:MAG: hypothetical protein KIS61_13115 [Candidatus Eremiobacteraeota bacterium]|nr:hypothetical protein [Candidatus Eremiobacteraeota bacterium]
MASEPTATSARLLADAKQKAAQGDVGGAEQLAKVAAFQELCGSKDPLILAEADSVVATCRYKAGDLSGAITRMVSCVHRAPGNPKYRSLLSTLRLERSRKRRTEAEQLLSEAGHLIRGYQGKGEDLEQARSKSERARTLFKDFGGTNEQISRALMIGSVATAISGDEKQALVLIGQARRLKDQKNYRELEQMYRNRLSAPAQVAHQPSREIPRQPDFNFVPQPRGVPVPDNGEAIVEKVLGDYCMVETSTGFGVIELYSGTVDEGDKIVGTVETYGLFDLHNATTDQELRGYIEEFGETHEEALEKLVEKAQ